MQGQSVFGKNSHESLKKVEGILKMPVLKLLLCRNVDSEEKKRKKLHEQTFLQCNNFML